MSSHALCSDDKSSDQEQQEAVHVSRQPRINQGTFRSNYKPAIQTVKSNTVTNRPVLPTGTQISQINPSQPRKPGAGHSVIRVTKTNNMGNIESQGGQRLPGNMSAASLGQGLRPTPQLSGHMLSSQRLPMQSPSPVSTPGVSVGGQQVSIISRQNPQVSNASAQPINFHQHFQRGTGSSLSGPRAGVVTPMLRPPTTQLAGSQQAYQLLQSRLPTVASKISTVRPSTPPIQRTASPAVTQMLDSRTSAPNTTNTTTVQITIQPSKGSVPDVIAKSARTITAVTPLSSSKPLSTPLQQKVLISQPGFPVGNAPTSAPISSLHGSSSGGTTSSPTVSSIPIAKVTPTRQHIPQVMSSTNTNTGTSSSDSSSILVSQNHHGSPNTSSSVLNLSTSVSHSDVRPHRPTLPMGIANFPHPPPHPSGLYYNTDINYYSMMAQHQPWNMANAFRPGYSQPNLAAQLTAPGVTGVPSMQMNTAGTVVVDPRKITSAHSQKNVSSSSTDTSLTTVTTANNNQRPPGSPSNQNSTQPANPNASPRPSILRKRTNEGMMIVRKPNFSSLEAGSPQSRSNNNSPKPASSMISLDLSVRPENNDHSSTDTAPSTENNSPSQRVTPLDNNIKLDTDASTPVENGQTLALSLSSALNSGTGSAESSPRKKPRKQLLNASEELKDGSSSEEESPETKKKKMFAKMKTLEESMEIEDDEQDEDEGKVVIKEDYVDEEGIKWVVMRKRYNAPLVNSYHCTWKSRNNHFQRYTDVKQKEERRPTVNELSNQKGITQKASGWRLYHLAAQLEEMVDLENNVKANMDRFQQSIAPKANVMNPEEIVKIQELTQGNKQRCKLVIDQLGEVRTSMLKLLDHKPKITEIINKHHSKRSVKKKERL